jgi:HEAT repeat protein
LVADLRVANNEANRHALRYLFDIASSRNCDLLGDRKADVASALVPWLDVAAERKNVLMILGKIGPDAKEAVPAIRRFVRRSTPDLDLALAAQYALQDIGENAAAAVPDLVESFPRFYFGSIDDPQYRGALPLTLIAIAPSDPKVRELLRKGLQDEEGRVRVHAAWALWRLGVKTAEVKEVWRKAQGDDEAFVRLRVGVITARLARESLEVLPLALAALKDSDEGVRRETIDMLVKGAFEQAEVMQAFRERLDDSDWYVRATACEGLGKMGARAAEAVPQVKAALDDQVTMVRVYAARALYAIDPCSARIVVDCLVHALSDPDSDVRDEAATGLGKVGPAARSALPALRRALDDEWSNVRKAAAEAVSKIEQKSP